MRYTIITLILCLMVISSSTIFAQDWKTSIAEVYQKNDTTTWGKIYSWLFNSDQFGKSCALVIGVGDYKSDWQILEAPYHDAIRMRDFLIHDEGFDYVITLTNAKATKVRINTLMEETFPKHVGKNDRFLFYYSGHGTQRRIAGSPLGYLPLQNSGIETYGNMISMEEIERWDRVLSPTRHVLFILDCCFSGLAGMQKKSPLTDKKLNRLSQYAHYLITAGTENEESVASSKWNGSLFTDSFLKAVSGRADLESIDFKRDGVVCLKELMKYIGDRIDDESVKIKSKNPLSGGIKMSPQISNLQDSAGEFFFITKNIKNEKVGNASDKELAYGWAVKGTTEDQIRLIQSPIVDSIIEKRSETTNLIEKKPAPTPPLSNIPLSTDSSDDVKAMLMEKKLFDSDWKINGKEFDNEYVLTAVRGDKVVIDRASGLMWQQSGSSEYMIYEKAKKWIDDLNNKGYASYHDWRLPTVEEAMSLMEPKEMNGGLYIDPVFEKKQRYIWTSDKVQDNSRAWVVDFTSGGCHNYDLYYYSDVRAVRTGQSSSEITYLAMKKAVYPPSLHSTPFSGGLSNEDVKTMLKEKNLFDKDWNTNGIGFDNEYVPITLRGDKVIIDRSAGLLWQQSGSMEYMGYEVAKQWIKDLNKSGYAGYTDWRLPTLEEAMSLMEPNQMNGNLYIDPVFDKHQRYIWTYETVQGASRVWVVGFDIGKCYGSDLNANYYIRAVISGQSFEK